MSVGAQNQLTGTVAEIKEGGVMCQVKVKLDGVDKSMASVMTIDSLHDMKLKKGDKVTVVVKAVNVLLTK